MLRNFLFSYQNFVNSDQIIQQKIQEINVKSQPYLIFEFDQQYSILTKEKIVEILNTFNLKRNYFCFLVIKNIDLLSKEIANSLLLFLESLPEQVCCIFFTHKLFDVLDTIKSRCMVLSLGFDHVTFNQFIKEKNIKDIALITLLKNSFASVNSMSIFCQTIYFEIHKIYQIIAQKDFSNFGLINKFIKTTDFNTLQYFLLYVYYQAKNINIKQQLNDLINHLFFNINRQILSNNFLGVVYLWKQS